MIPRGKSLSCGHQQLIYTQSAGEGKFANENNQWELHIQYISMKIIKYPYCDTLGSWFYPVATIGMEKREESLQGEEHIENARIGRT